jgi:uncharacterized protein
VIEMELVGVRVEVSANTPMLVLREQGGQQRVMPILIGTPEASAIHTAIEGIVPPRPLTHDLVVVLLSTLDASVERVLITEVREHTYFAELHLLVAGVERSVSCRPSDAVAVAVRCAAPIFASEALLDEVAQRLPDDVADDADEAILDEFRDFLDDIDPSDFK